MTRRSRRRAGASTDAAAQHDGVLLFVGLVIGAAFGLIVIGFLSIGAYDRGYEAALRERTLRRLHA